MAKSTGDTEETYAATVQSVKDAAARIEGHINHTPVHTSSAVDSMAAPGQQLLFKCEVFQKGYVRTPLGMQIYCPSVGQSTCWRV